MDPDGSIEELTIWLFCNSLTAYSNRIIFSIYIIENIPNPKVCDGLIFCDNWYCLNRPTIVYNDLLMPLINRFNKLGYGAGRLITDNWL